jgi:hypothetical protein
MAKRRISTIDVASFVCFLVLVAYVLGVVQSANRIGIQNNVLNEFRRRGLKAIVQGNQSAGTIRDVLHFLRDHGIGIWDVVAWDRRNN